MELPHARLGRHGVLVMLLLAVVSMAIFAPAVDGPFVYDDQTLILENVRVHSFAFARQWFTSHFWDVGADDVRFSLNYYRPLVTASYALDWVVGRGNPALFHLTNLLWYGAVVALAFATARRWLGSLAPAVIATIVFAFHPTKAESVAWIAGRTDLLCTVGMLGALAGVRLRLEGRRALGLAIEVAGTLFAYLTKETALALPLLVAAEVWVARGRRPLRRDELVAALRAALAHVGLAAAYLVARNLLLPVAGEGHWTLRIVDRAALFLETFGRFVALVFAPVELSVQQALLHMQQGRPIFSLPHVLLGALALIAIAILALRSRIERPMLTVAAVLFVLTLLPTSNLKPTLMATLVSERFLFLPLFFVGLIAGECAPRVGRRALIALTAAIALLFVARATVRANDFSDERAFWTRELRLHPDSLTALRNAAGFARIDRRNDDALRYYFQAHDQASRWFPYIPGSSTDFAMSAVDLIAATTPDARRADLIAMARFYNEVATSTESQPVGLELPSVRLKLGLPNTPRIRAAFVRRAQMGAARLESRLGDDGPAVARVRAAVAACERCPSIRPDAALILARAGLYPEALGLLRALPQTTAREALREIETAFAQHQIAATSTGPVALILRARELVTLVAWGRAHDVMAPHVDSFRAQPEIAVAYGELAYRAGYDAEARAVLTPHLGPEQVAVKTLAWSRAMGWTP